jgi:hypothetical protein
MVRCLRGWGELRKSHLPGTCVGCGLGWSGRGGVQVWPRPCLPQQPSGRADQGYREKYFIVQYAGARGPTSELYSFSVKLWRALRLQNSQSAKWVSTKMTTTDPLIPLPKHNPLSHPWIPNSGSPSDPSIHVLHLFCQNQQSGAFL